MEELEERAIIDLDQDQDKAMDMEDEVVQADVIVNHIHNSPVNLATTDAR